MLLLSHDPHFTFRFADDRAGTTTSYLLTPTARPALRVVSPPAAGGMMPSLCESCVNVRVVRTARSQFLLCELSVADPAYPKYPRQPVVRCDGYQPRPETTEDDQGNPTDQTA